MKEKKKVILNDWWRQFLTGVMGTAIGVGLTFAVSNWVEGNRKEQAQRQTAMMAVYDIDEIIRELKEDLERENTMYPLALYLSSHPGKIDAVSDDTVRQAVVYLLDDPTSMPDWAADAKEKAFTSGMDAWQNLENTQFYNNVQKCYQCRAELLRAIDQDVVFRQPISDAALDKFIEKSSADDLDYDGSLTAAALRRLLKQTYGKPEALRYLRMHLLRIRIYNGTINELTRLNKENKFLMELSDEEMEAYIRKNIQKTKPATVDLMAGVWEDQLNEGIETIRLRPDHTMDFTYDMTDMAILSDGSEGPDIQLNVPVSYRLSGEWTLQGDSVHLYCFPGKGELLSVDLDVTGLPESLQEKGREWETTYRQRFEEYLESAGIDQWYSVFFDMTGDLMFLSYSYSDSLGDTKTARFQLSRKQE